MNTGRIETIGLTLIVASVILFTVTAFVRETTRPADRPGLDAQTARTLDIAIRARSAGRDEQADALLAALVAPAGAATVPGYAFGFDAWTDRHLGGIERPGCWYGAAIGAGVVGLLVSGVASRRRRSTLELLARELDRPFSADDADALVGAVFRLRVEHAGAEYQLLISRDAVATLPSRSAIAASFSLRTSDSAERIVTPDGIPTAESDFGRIVEISTIELD